MAVYVTSSEHAWPRVFSGILSFILQRVKMFPKFAFLNVLNIFVVVVYFCSEYVECDLIRS